MFNLNLKYKIKKTIKSIYSDEFDKKIILEAKRLGLKNNKLSKISDLSKVEFRVFSQWGEDGIIDWLINKIKKIPNSFLEIGTEDYKESNTRYLLLNNGWDGYLIEGDKSATKKIKQDRIFWKYNLNLAEKYLNLSNFDEIIKELKIPKKIGLISLDIDGNDYWILQKLKFFKPVIFICEFNPLFGYKKSISVPYKKIFNRTKEHYSNLYFGASIKAIQNTLKKEFIFIGTNSAGNNAFFINKKFKKYIVPKIKKYKIYRSKFKESRNKSNKLNYLNKKQSINLLKNKKIIDLKNNKILTIKEIINEI